MPVSPHEAEIAIAAAPEAVWDLVSDITRVGEWSPQCYRTEWLDGATGPAPGARFKGYNRLGAFKWTRVCHVDECVKGSVFEFTTWTGSRKETTWRYEVRPADGGTLLTESFSNAGAPVYVKVINALARKRQHADRIRNLEGSLARIKAIAESGAR